MTPVGYFPRNLGLKLRYPDRGGLRKLRDPDCACDYSWQSGVGRPRR